MCVIVSLAQRPDLGDAMWELESSWPTFMLKDPIAGRLFGEVPNLFPDLQLIACEDDVVVGRIFALPFHTAGGLPDRGWDAAIEAGVQLGERPREAVSLLEARVAPRGSSAASARRR